MEREPCNTSLGLGLGAASDAHLDGGLGRPRENKAPVRFHVLFPTCAKREEEEEEELVVVECTGPVRKQAAADEQRMSRLRLRSGEEEEEAEDKDSRESGGGTRKKLRLTKEQSTLLEGSFRERNTLTQTQKQELADRLNLRPRQVEVWFQNRRARTKLKQTEVDCEFLKKYCESLSDENRRLKRELQELRSVKPPGPPFYVQLPKAATLTICPACERIAAVDCKIGAGGDAFDAVVSGAAKARFYNCAIKDSSMAC